MNLPNKYMGASAALLEGNKPINPQIAVFLGAGFSATAGVPLASQLFDSRPLVDRITRRKLVDRVVAGWERWSSRNGGSPEEYLACLQKAGGRDWLDAQWYVGLVVALAMGRVQYVGLKPTITRHNIDRTTQVATHEDFWRTIFLRTSSVAVVTTNYDILPERGVRHRPRPRILRPGCHYGDGPVELAGGGYPSYAHIQRIGLSGTVPILKLHGSVSWSCKGSSIVRYHDCRLAIRGDAAIVAPVTAKTLPPFLRPVWKHAATALKAARLWLVVGYSLPEFDGLVRHLLQESSADTTAIHVFDPDNRVVERFKLLLPGREVVGHAGLPVGLAALDEIVRDWCDPSRDALAKAS